MCGMLSAQRQNTRDRQHHCHDSYYQEPFNDDAVLKMVTVKVFFYTTLKSGSDAMGFWPYFCYTPQYALPIKESLFFLSSSQKLLPISGCLCRFKPPPTQRKGLYAICILRNPRSFISKVSQDWSINIAQKRKGAKNANAKKQSSRQIDLQGGFLLFFPFKYREIKNN